MPVETAFCDVCFDLVCDDPDACEAERARQDALAAEEEDEA